MMNDDRLQQQLMLKTARFNQKGVDIEIFKAMINQATNTGGFVDYSEAYDFAEGISNVIDNIEELLKEGFANEVIELTEYAMIRIEEALGEMDDSDGYMSDMLDRLEEIHYKACKKAAPDPETLARCLFTWEINTNWDTFYGAVDTYADVLGDKGLAVYRKLAEAEWSKLPELEPGQTEGRYFSERHRLNSIMETLAVLDNDTEALVAVKKKDLSYAYHFLEIAQIYKDAEDKEKALEWAERGLKAFPKNTDSRLREFLADEYHSRKRHDEAMQLIWLNFIEHPGLENYKSLKQHAERVIEWSKWRQESLEYIRSAAAGEQKSKTSAQLYRNESWYNSMLVRIFLWEKDIESAWLEAKKGGCHNDLWMELARLREKSHPEDAIEIYKNQVVSLVQRTNNQAYREAIILIKNIRKLMNSLKKVEEFSVYVSFLKSNYKPKRNFMKLLDKLR